MNSQTQAHAGSQAVDPICGMTVDPGKALQASYAGVAFYFCGDNCVQKFKSNPSLYSKTEAQPQEGGCCQPSPAKTTTQDSGGCC